MADEKNLIRQQIEYYRARAAEYNEWFFRTGRYDRGEKHRQQWFAEIKSVREALKLSKPSGHILELACGTGLWTEYLAAFADKLLAVDVSPEMIEINRKRLSNNTIEYKVVNLIEWQPKERYDYIFFGFWLSHVPKSEFDKFWDKIKTALKPTGLVFFIDSLLIQESTAKNHVISDRSGLAKRKLNDGREFEIVKHFYDPQGLEKKLNKLSWSGQIETTDNFFLYGCLNREE